MEPEADRESLIYAVVVRKGTKYLPLMSSPFIPATGVCSARAIPFVTNTVSAMSHPRYCKVVTGGYSLARVGCISIVVHCDRPHLHCLVDCVYVACNYSELHAAGCALSTAASEVHSPRSCKCACIVVRKIACDVYCTYAIGHGD